MAWLAEKGERRSFAAGRGALRAGPARRALLRDRERPGRPHRPQAGQGDLDRRGRRRDVHRRHRDLHGRARDGGVRGRRADRDDRLRPAGPARDAGGQARDGRAACWAACWPAAPGTRAPGTASCASSPSAARGAPSRSATCWSATSSRSASTTSTSTPTPTRSSTGSRSRARRPPSSSATTASCATPPPPRWPASSACARRSTASASTWSCSAAARPGWPRRSPAGSEGLRTFVAEAWGPGGQAGTSSRIENYLGFPSGISGAELTRAATLQARRFDAVLSSFHRAVELTDGPEGLARVDLDDGQHVLGRAVVMATGARWRELAVPDVERYRGRGPLPRGHAGRRRALPRRGRAGGRRGQLGRAGGDPPRAARAQRPRGGARRRPLQHHVALPGRPHRALAPHRGADPDGGRRRCTAAARSTPSPSATAAAARSGCRCGRSS